MLVGICRQAMMMMMIIIIIPIHHHDHHDHIIITWSRRHYRALARPQWRWSRRRHPRSLSPSPERGSGDDNGGDGLSDDAYVVVVRDDCCETLHDIKSLGQSSFWLVFSSWFKKMSNHSPPPPLPHHYHDNPHDLNNPDEPLAAARQKKPSWGRRSGNDRHKEWQRRFQAPECDLYMIMINVMIMIINVDNDNLMMAMLMLIMCCWRWLKHLCPSFS